MSKKKLKSLFTVRGKKHERHPQIIVQSDKTGFGSVSLTHSRKKGGKNTVLLPDNPDANDSRQSYFAKKIVRDFKFNFTKAYRNYKLSDDDIDELIRFLERKKNQR